jgi:hypothetical protein
MVKVGRAIRAGPVISQSAKIVSSRPLIMLPQLILLAVSLVTDLSNSPSALNPLRIVITLVSVVLSLIVSGAYPSMVKTVLEGGEPSVAESLGKALHRFWTLLAAGILVALIVGLGFIALVVPGVILLTWYAYTVPAIMLEDKGALEGMAASKAFGRDKKGDTFLIFIALGMAGIVLFVVRFILSLASPVLGNVAYAVLDVPLGAWASVIFSYTYLTCGPSSVPTTTETVGYGLVPPPPPQPPAQANAPVGAPANFCQFCGSRIAPGSKFCGACGKPVGY